MYAHACVYVLQFYLLVSLITRQIYVEIGSRTLFVCLRNSPFVDKARALESPEVERTR